MTFDLNWYSSPLLFGFLQGWIYALLFWVRAWRQERLSDALFGTLLAALTFEIWEYMLGFAGINVLWDELEFFPRTFGLLIPALFWLYLKSQFNAQFRLQWQHAWHLLPFLGYCMYHLLVFSQGAEFVTWWQEQVHFAWGIANLEAILSLVLTVVYFYHAYRLYQQYRSWTPTQFSTPELVSFSWFRNFLWAGFLSSLISWSMTLIDIWLALDFWHDWWDELFNAGLIYYLGITGYAQTQPRSLVFDPSAEEKNETESPKVEKLKENELEQWREELNRLMENEKLYLEPELALADLARRLNTNSSILSAAINRAFGKNFNDYVNGYRVEQVKQLLQDPAVAHLSLLGIGLECGFNSKATFNRAFKKATGLSPREFMQVPEKMGD
jgi:AraC-like DNA-binding protein